MDTQTTEDESFEDLWPEDTRDYVAILASVSDAEREAFGARFEHPAFDDTFPLPDGGTIMERDVKADNVDRVIDALGDEAMVAKIALWTIRPALEQGLSYADAYLAHFVSREREDAATKADNAAKLAAFKPRPPLPDEFKDYRRELDSMDERERAAAATLIAKTEKGSFECAPGERYIRRSAVTLDMLDGIEALEPSWGEYFDHIRPRMAQGLTYSEAVVSLALGNTRRAGLAH